MRLHGYCEHCHRIKLVRVRTRSLGQLQRIPIGICASCEERDDQRRRAR